MTARSTPSRSGQSREPDRPRAPRSSDASARSSSTPPDADLVAAIQSGDPDALSTLLTRYQDRLYAVCLRMVANPDTAADLTQDTMVKVIQGLSSWDGRAALSTWMIRIAMNVTLSHLRAQKLRRHASLEGLASPPASTHSRESRAASGRPTQPAPFEQAREPDIASRVQKEELRQRVAGALAALEPDQRAILILRDMQEFDYEQIAAVLEVAVGTVKSRLFRARAALRKALEEQTDTPSDNPGADLP